MDQLISNTKTKSNCYACNDHLQKIIHAKKPKYMTTSQIWNCAASKPRLIKIHHNIAWEKIQSHRLRVHGCNHVEGTWQQPTPEQEEAPLGRTWARARTTCADMGASMCGLVHREEGANWRRTSLAKEDRGWCGHSAAAGFKRTEAMGVESRR